MRSLLRWLNKEAGRSTYVLERQVKASGYEEDSNKGGFNEER